MKRLGTAIILSGPSGVGKSTVCSFLFKKYTDLKFSVSCTTRAPRPGEVDGVAYHFLTVDDFKRRIDAGDFLEWAEVHGNYYGTLKAPIEEILEEGNSVILDIDVAGAAKVRSYVASLPPDAPMRAGYMDVFIMPPSMEELRERLEKRGTDSQETIEKRLKNADGEMARAGEYMYRIVNDELDTAYRRLCDLIDVRSGRM